jgi:hypothetical protein
MHDIQIYTHVNVHRNIYYIYKYIYIPVISGPNCSLILLIFEEIAFPKANNITDDDDDV